VGTSERYGQGRTGQGRYNVGTGNEQYRYISAQDRGQRACTDINGREVTTQDKANSSGWNDFMPRDVIS
jgi:hypothetical protein